jgi:hypothetical protein
VAAHKKSDASTPEHPEEEAPYVHPDQVDLSDYPRNEFGTLLNPEDGQPVFNTITGESRHQYLARKFEEDKAALLEQLAAGTATDDATPQAKD